jgi:hypothetical protein
MEQDAIGAVKRSSAFQVVIAIHGTQLLITAFTYYLFLL